MSLIVYKSSAGSGKTSTLVIEYLVLALKNPSQFRKIIALTFTLKATNEMKERLLQYLVYIKDYKSKEANPKMQFVVDDIIAKTGFDEEELMLRAEQLLSQILHNYSDFGFSTIDSFVVKIVRSFAHDLQLSSNFEIELDKDVLIHQAIEKMYENIGVDPQLTQFLLDFTLAQIEDEKSPKLDDSLNKLASLIFDSKHYDHIELLKSVPIENFIKIKKILRKSMTDFDQKMKDFGNQGIECIEQSGLVKMSFSAGWLWNYFVKLKELQDDVYNISKIENKTFLIKVNQDEDWYAKSQKPDVKSRVDAAKPALNLIIEEARAFHHQQLPVYLSHLLIYNKITPLALIHELKKLIDLKSEETDIIHLSEVNRKISEVVKDQHAPYIYERIGQRFNHFLVDEFQDTSVIQWNNLLPLIDNSLASGYKNLLVGDAKQSIYRWRDGEVEQFVNLPLLKGAAESKLIAERQALIQQVFESVNLDVNYRSLKNIVDFNNVLFNSLIEQEPSYVTMFFQNHQQKTLRTKNEGQISLQYIDDRSDELHQAILAQIIDLTVEQNYQLGDICILARKNKPLVELAEFLTQNQVNVVSSDALYLYKSKPVMVIISFMQIINEIEIPSNIHFILRFLLDEKQLQTIPTFKNAPSFFLYLTELGYSLNEAKMHQMETFELAEYIIKKINFEQAINAYLFNFLDLIIDQTKKIGASCRQFLDFWEEKQTKLKIDMAADSNAVQLITIHKAKGLEFPVVLFPVLGFDSSLGNRDYLWAEPETQIAGLIPKVLIGDEKRGLQSDFEPILTEELDRKRLDELNMVYVACTRPTEQLHLFFTSEAKSKTFWNNRIAPIQWEGLDLKKNESNHIIIGEPKLIKKHDIKVATSMQIENYIQNDWRKRIQLKRELPKNQIHINIEKGIQLHELLMNLNTESSVQEIIHQAELNKKLSPNYRDEFTSILNALITNEKFKTFFNAADLSWSEREIINPQGEIFRPDKIILKGDQLWILDYKYADYSTISEQEKSKHQNQIIQYIDLINQIHGDKSQAFLLYLHTEIQIVRILG